MKSIYIKIFLGLLVCGGFRAYAAPVANAAVSEYCTLNGAYTSGLNDGLTAHAPMLPDYADLQNCAAASQDALNSAYKQGFLDGLSHRPRTTYQTVLQYPNGLKVNEN